MARRRRKDPTAQQSPLRAEPERAPLAVPRKLQAKSHELIGAPPLDRPRRGRQGHPARQTRDDKRRGWFTPDEREKLVREQNRIVREELKASTEDDGPLAGLIRATARCAAAEHAAKVGLDDAETIAALAHFLAPKIGAAIGSIDLAELQAWRDECRERLVA